MLGSVRKDDCHLRAEGVLTEGKSNGLARLYTRRIILLVVARDISRIKVANASLIPVKISLLWLSENPKRVAVQVVLLHNASVDGRWILLKNGTETTTVSSGGQ